ncbi:unnamed protein product [Tetraodon nigroviridis]|uniref:(spotted green pufferfish) hypothetical protein n=1 Tax=Tetraodon nigroviridis TaxID=99883 RepID=Q4RI50_TETNG|nr:unnamed protein product [Tetraodon nigroviridis]
MDLGEAKQLPKKKMDIRPQLPKPPASKSSATQNIYGTFSAQPERSNQQNTPLRSQSQMSGLDWVPLTGAVNQARRYSYHLRPRSAGQGSAARGKE